MYGKAIQKYLAKHKLEQINVKALLFDMDGVLFNSMPNHAKAWKQAMQENGIEFSEYDTYLNEGQAGLDTIKIAFEKQKNRIPTQKECEDIYHRKGEIFSTFGMPKQIPYALQMVDLAIEKGLQVFVVTGSGHQELLDYLLENYPNIKKENIVSALNIKRGKPAPDPYLKALELAGVKHNEAVVVENAPLGIQSATSAKIFTIAITTGLLEKEVLEKSGADLVFDSMQSLFTNWNQLNL